MKDIFSVDYRDAIRVMVRKELKNNYGLKIPKINTKDKNVQQNKCKYFGASLENMPSKNIKEDQYFAIPIFLVDAFNYLKDHLNVEGLFRKSGSTARQKALREVVETEGTFSKDEHYPHDIASLVKQFFRELPNPLLTTQFSPVFYKCFNLLKTNQKSDALFLCTLLLPDEHLRVLRYLVECINEVGNHSMQTKMSLRNLGIVFAPNLVYISNKDSNNEKLLLETSELVDHLFKNPDRIGMVPETIMEKAISMHLDDGALSSSGDEIDEGFRRGRSLSQNGERKRERSKSITKFLRRGFKSAERKSNNPRDIHGAVISPQRWVNSDKLKGSSSSSLNANNQDSNDSPIRKSPRLEKNNQHPTISLPVLKTIPNQAFTPRNKLQSVDKLSKDIKTNVSTPVLPSKFDLSRGNNRNANAVNNRTNSSRGTATRNDQNIPPSNLPQSRISRRTQKPHVRKSRRASSVDRRRARYQVSPDLRKAIPNNSPATTFTDENLTVNIAFMEDDNLPLNVDALSFDNNRTKSPHSNAHSKIPRWKSQVNHDSTPVSKNLRNKCVSNPDIKSGSNQKQNCNSKSRGRKN